MVQRVAAEELGCTEEDMEARLQALQVSFLFFLCFAAGECVLLPPTGSLQSTRRRCFRT